MFQTINSFGGKTEGTWELKSKLSTSLSKHTKKNKVVMKTNKRTSKQTITTKHISISNREIREIWF